MEDGDMRPIENMKFLQKNLFNGNPSRAGAYAEAMKAWALVRLSMTIKECFGPKEESLEFKTLEDGPELGNIGVTPLTPDAIREFLKYYGNDEDTTS